MERQFEHNLESVRQNLIRMGGLIECMIGEAVQALDERDSQKADHVIRQDEQVDRLEIEIQAICQKILALQQPLATDLRFLLAAMQMTTDLERMGDCAGNVAQSVLHLNQEAPLTQHQDLAELASRTRAMVRSSLDAFVQRDEALARRTWEEDDLVDDLYKGIFADLVKQMSSDEAVVTRGLQILLIARHLERIADHASNLCEEVVFFVTGKDIRHSRTVYEPQL